MTEVIGIRFKSGGKQYYFNPNGVHVDVGEHVIIETSKGVEFAECVQSNFMVDEMELVSTLRPMLRVATKEDFLQVERNKEREKNAYKICQKKILEHGLEMKLVDVKYSFDGSKILFYFTADGRVDFRSLVKDLASVFRTRIELRQIGVRDEARMMGGLGVCGRPFCCTQFLEDFQPVSIKMAKTQSISLSPTKISGSCGRLMCCLKYEQDAYEDLLKHAPKLESLVKTPDGVGVINQVNLLREQCQVVLDRDPDEVHIYKNNELEIIRSGKGKRPAGYEKPEKAEKPSLQPRFQKESAEPQEQKPQAEPPRKKKTSQPRKNSRPAPAKQGDEEKRSSGGTSRRRHRPHHRRSGESSGTS
ncbi:MAG: stage 0 sporulation protein [Clostridiales bacterium]|nr:stage 0 sporulation protein [Clostridiales bacterium]